MTEDPHFEELANLDKRIKILEKKLRRSEENRLHTQEMKDKSQLFLKRLKSEIDDANALIQKRNEELKVLKEQAEESARIKSDFLANMSHEIRTPMNAIIGFANLIYKTELSLKQKDYIDKIGNAAHNLLHIINDILDFSKIDAGKLKLELIKFKMEEVMDNLANIISLKAFNKGLELIIMQDPKIPGNLEGDPLRLGQVLLNLTDNAIKFTERGEIFVRVSLESESEADVELLFEVEDMGIGMTAEQKSNIFQAFSQADTSTTRKYGGTGLGLIISKQLVELMQGNINIKSEYGKGSNFFFTARFKKATERSSSRRALPGELEKIQILVIEENKNAREVLELYLRNLGFKNVECTDKRTGLDLLKCGLPYDLVFVSSKQSGNDGIRILRGLRKYFVNKEMPKFIMLTGYVRENVTQNAKKEGFDELLMKPVNQSALYDTVISLFVKNTESLNAFSHAADSLKSDWDISGVRVLLAEDNDINRQVACEYLESQGAKVCNVKNGIEAYNMIKDRKEEFDIILMDLHMPILDGYKASRKIKNEIRNLQIPIIALTADAMPGTKERVFNWEMDDFLTKPIVPGELFSKIEKWVSDKAASDLEPILENEQIYKEDISDDIKKGEEHHSDHEDYIEKIENLISLLKDNDSRSKKIFEEVEVFFNRQLPLDDVQKLHRYISQYDFEEAGTLIKEKLVL